MNDARIAQQEAPAQHSNGALSGAPLMISDKEAGWHKPNEAARLLAISVSYLRKLTADGQVQASGRTQGGHRRYSDEDVAKIRAFLRGESCLTSDSSPASEPELAKTPGRDRSKDYNLSSHERLKLDVEYRSHQARLRLDALTNLRDNILREYELPLRRQLARCAFAQYAQNVGFLLGALSGLAVILVWALREDRFHHPGMGLALVITISLGLTVGGFAGYLIGVYLPKGWLMTVERFLPERRLAPSPHILSKIEKSGEEGGIITPLVRLNGQIADQETTCAELEAELALITSQLTSIEELPSAI